MNGRIFCHVHVRCGHHLAKVATLPEAPLCTGKSYDSLGTAVDVDSQANLAVQQPASYHIAMGVERELQSLLRQLNGLHGLRFLLVGIHPPGRNRNGEAVGCGPMAGRGGTVDS